MFDPDVRTPASELNQRISKFQQHLQQNQVDGALILQNADLYYFSGTVQQGHLYIPAQGEALLMVRKSMQRALSDSALARIVALNSSRGLATALTEQGYALPRRLGMELDVLPANLYLSFQKLLPDCEIVDVSHAIRLVRAVKSPHEIALIRACGRKSDQLAGEVAEFIQAGMSEIELAARIEGRAREMGHQGIVRMRLWGSELFYGHVMAGQAAAVPSFLSSPTGGTGMTRAIAQGSSLQAIKPHEPILVDFVFAQNGYLTDHTRIFAIGDLPDELLAAHAAMREVQRTIKQAAKPGITAGALYDLALQTATEQGFGDNFMGVGPRRIRFMGHGVGLELDEYPFLAKGQKMVIEENMVIALEPKAIFPDRGVVGIENTHLVTLDGLEQLTVISEDVVFLSAVSNQPSAISK